VKGNAKNVMFYLILMLVISNFLWSIINGSLKHGMDNSMRNSNLRMHYMQQVLYAFNDEGDAYKILYSSEKQGNAFVDVSFNNLDWNRSARNDLYGILDKQGWSKKSDGKIFCRDGASLKISGGTQTLDDKGRTNLTMEYSSTSIYECT